MEVKNCNRCGRMFQAVSTEKLCSRCRSTDDEDFKVVREYIYDNPDTSVKEVAEDTGVPEEKILKYLRDGKLLLKGENANVLDCERCGKGIATGRFCDECSAKLARELKSAFAVPDKPVSDEETKKTKKGFYSKRH